MWKFCTNRFWRVLTHLALALFSLLYAIFFFNHVTISSRSNLQFIEDHRDSKNIQNVTLKLNPIPLPTTFNLMEETQHGRKWTNSDFQHLCTVEYANVKKLQQDHPCVLHLIKNAYLRQPIPRNIPYNLNYPELVDPSDGQSKAILRLLRNMTNGFFIECGGFDGEYLSNTLFMERSLNWTGLLIEADKKSFHQLSNRNRKAYIAPVCLSTQPYPMEVLYDTTNALLSSIVEEKDKELQHVTGDINQKTTLNNSAVYKTQCFPLYSVLLAIGKTTVDYFGLDVEGSEYKILRTIPWHKVEIKTLTVEWDHTPEGEAAITRLLEMNKFVKFGHIEMAFSREVVYVQDFLNDLRLYE